MLFAAIPIVIIIFFLAFIGIILFLIKNIESPQKRFGRLSENRVKNIISSMLNEDDHYFTNVEISYNDSDCEIDNIVVNKYGVFIFEVKNYIGVITGNEDQYDWIKHKTTDAGNTYSKIVKNPIKQVKRQSYILKKYLAYYGVDVWITNHAILLQGNSPVQNEIMLNSVHDIKKIIHTPSRTLLTPKKINQICELLTIEQ